MRITLLLAALLAGSIAHVPARADTLGPINSTVMPKQWPDGPLKDFLEKLQRPDAHLYPYFEGNPISCCGAGDVVDTKFRVEHGKGPHPEVLGSKASGSAFHRKRSCRIMRRTDSFLFVQMFYSPSAGFR